MENMIKIIKKRKVKGEDEGKDGGENTVGLAKFAATATTNNG